MTCICTPAPRRPRGGGRAVSPQQARPRAAAAATRPHATAAPPPPPAVRPAAASLGSRTVRGLARASHINHHRPRCHLHCPRAAAPARLPTLRRSTARARHAAPRPPRPPLP
eukprot:scaffold28143_cov55-Phaeocystis_antarctica.AAC.3